MIPRITTPGIYPGIPEAEYHADPCPVPSLSSSLARTMLYDSPAHARLEHPRLNSERRERKSTSSLVLGSLVHALLSDLGAIEVGEFTDYKTKAAQEWRKEAEASGATPVLQRDLEAAQPIADAIKRTVGAGFFNDSEEELTVAWRERGQWLRARLDCWHEPTAAMLDWKTCADISDRGIERGIADRRYAFQVAFYLRGLRASGIDDASAALIFAETTPPYTVRRAVLSDEYLRHAEREVEKAVALWCDCMESGKFEDPRNGQTMDIHLPSYLAEDIDITVD
jgi:hypothetical protein